MKAVAFYLPQYHVIPENEEAYGKDFTEWDNVRNAMPLFPGHYQPHVPHKLLGYYNLLDEKAIALQHELAYTNNIRAFCYYYYNMGGKTLLEAPLRLINASRHLKNEFCLCWDHNSWATNRYNVPKRITVQQTYSLEAAKNFIHALVPYFDNLRYIHINGKPLLLVFVPERHPLMKEYVHIWREEMHHMGFDGIYLAGIEAFMPNHPSTFGFDCMVEYAPGWQRENLLSAPDEIPKRQDYAGTVKSMITKPIPNYHRMRCIFPGWDNTPRRGADGMVGVGSDPKIFGLMAHTMAQLTQECLPQELQYLFINAWNEWGEGCHLEPDERYGFQYLHALRDVMDKYTQL